MTEPQPDNEALWEAVKAIPSLGVTPVMVDEALALARIDATQLHGDIALIPFKDGEPDWDITRADLDWPDLDIEPADLPRLAIITDSFHSIDADVPMGAGVTTATWRDAEGTPHVRAIEGVPAYTKQCVGIIERSLATGWPVLYRKRPEAVTSEASPAAEKPARFDLTWFDDIEEDATAKETFIKGYFGMGEYTTVSGLPGTGKSVIMTDAACHVAAGMEWHGRRVKQGFVVYIAAERKKLTERRMLAFKKRHGVEDVPLLVLGGRIDLTSNLNDARAVATAINEAAEAYGEACIWFIVDTLTRTFGAGDQNTSKDMTKFIMSCDEMTRLTGAHCTVIHHTAWAGERMKGAIDLDGAVDASFLVKKSGKVYTLECNGSNDGEEGVVVQFGMEGVAVGKDEEGEITYAPVVVPSDGPASKLMAAHRGKAGEALSALRTAASTSGVEPEGDHFPEGVTVVTEDQWREAYYATLKNKTAATMRQSFGRAKKELLTAESVFNIGQWWWAAEA